MTTSISVINKIAQVSLFQDLGPAQLEEIALLVTRKKYPPNTPIISDNDEHYFYIISEGVVIIKSFDPTVKTAIAQLEPGDFFGEVSVIDSEPFANEPSSGDEEVELLIFTQKDFLELLQTCPSIHLALSREFCRRLRLLNHKLSNISLPGTARIARTLILIANEHGKMTREGLVLPKLSQSELGKMSDSPKDVINRALSELRDEGLISATESRQVLILSIEKLEEWIKNKAGISQSV